MATETYEDEYSSEDEDLYPFQKISQITRMEDEPDDDKGFIFDSDPYADLIIGNASMFGSKGILKNSRTSMLGGMNAPTNPIGFAGGTTKHIDKTVQVLPHVPKTTPTFATPISPKPFFEAEASPQAPLPFARVSKQTKPQAPNPPGPVPDTQDVSSPLGERSLTPVPLVSVARARRAENTKPCGGAGTDERGPFRPPNDPPLPPSGSPRNPGPPDNALTDVDSEWDFSPLKLILDSPLIWRSIPPSMIPSPLNPFTKEQVEFYLIKEYGSELYKSWLQANGNWHGVPEQPDTEDADGRPATIGLREIERRGGATEPGIHTSIWAPKMIGEDVYFQTPEDYIDSQLEAWESEDIDQLRPELGPTAIFQHTKRYNNYQTTSSSGGMTIWNGMKGGVYRFPCAARMSTERKPNETSEQYFARYDEAVNDLLKYPNDAESYEGQSKDRGAFQANHHVVRREFAIDIRRIERKSLSRWQPFEMPKKSFGPRRRKKESIYISDVHRKTEQAYIEDERDGQQGGTGDLNVERETLPTIDIAKLYTGEREDRPDPWIVPTDMELELRATRMDTINSSISSHSLKRPYLHNEFDEEYSKDLTGDTAYFVINTDPRPLKINGVMLLYQGQTAGPLPSFAFFEAPGGQIAFWWGIMGTFYKPVPRIARALGDILERYNPESAPSGPAHPPPRPPLQERKQLFGDGKGLRNQDPFDLKPIVEDRDRRGDAADKRLKRARKEAGDQWGKTKFRRPPSSGSNRFSSGLSFRTMQPANMHIRGGGGENKRKPALLERATILDSEGHYNFMEVYYDSAEELTESRQTQITQEAAMALRKHGVDFEDFSSQAKDPTPAKNPAHAPKRRRLSSTMFTRGKPGRTRGLHRTSAVAKPQTMSEGKTTRQPSSYLLSTAQGPATRPTANPTLQIEALTDSEMKSMRQALEKSLQSATRTRSAAPKPSKASSPTKILNFPKIASTSKTLVRPQRIFPLFAPPTAGLIYPNESPKRIRSPGPREIKELYDLPPTSAAYNGADEDFDNGAGFLRPFTDKELTNDQQFQPSFDAFEKRHVWDWDWRYVTRGSGRNTRPWTNVIGYGGPDDPDNAWMFEGDNWWNSGGKDVEEMKIMADIGQFNWLKKSDRFAGYRGTSRRHRPPECSWDV